MNDTNHPARRLRHGDRPTEPLTLEDAAANKAAEEGGLPMTVREAFEDRHEGYEFPSEALKSGAFGEYMAGWRAADRASRQVANKADHDVWGAHGEFAEFYLAGYEGRDICPTTKGNALAAYSNGIKAKVANKAEVEPVAFMYQDDQDLAEPGTGSCVVSKARCNFYRNETPLYATPPATTGASTVLTDERIKPWQERTTTRCGGWRTNREIDEARDAEISELRAALISAREVAAQAGQVAVPPGFAIVPRAINEDMHVAAVRAIHRATGNDDAPPAIWSAMISVAPSPAKESK